MKDNSLKDFVSIVNTLQSFWQSKGCNVVFPYSSQVGAGTFHPATFLNVLSDKDWNACYAQGCFRPVDGRYGENPNRLQHYYQYQVIMKPSPENIIELYLQSLEAIGINPKEHDIRFVEDDWASPTLKAAGIGWEVWCDGMEVTQFTYFQQVGGIACKQTPVEITYGLERIAMYILNVDNVYNLPWSVETGTTYGDLFLDNEKQYSAYNFEEADTDFLTLYFNEIEKQGFKLAEKGLVLPAYEKCMNLSHAFNVLEARGVISVSKRADYINRIALLAQECAKLYSNNQKEQQGDKNEQ